MTTMHLMDVMEKGDSNSVVTTERMRETVEAKTLNTESSVVVRSTRKKCVKSSTKSSSKSQLKSTVPKFIKTSSTRRTRHTVRSTRWLTTMPTMTIRKYTPMHVAVTESEMQEMVATNTTTGVTNGLKSDSTYLWGTLGLIIAGNKRLSKIIMFILFF